jgi:hypothetical protein
MSLRESITWPPPWTIRAAGFTVSFTDVHEGMAIELTYRTRLIRDRGRIVYVRK